MTKRRFAAGLAGVLGLALLLHWPVETRQGIDYTVTERTIPLYAKTIHFFSRAIAFEQLADELTAGRHGDQAKAEAIFDWVALRLYHGAPAGLPVVDDHTLNVVTRGYGTDDQFAELFAILCGYAGMPANRVILIVSQDPVRRMDAAAVKIDGAWRFADPFRGIAPKGADGRWLTLDALQQDPAPAIAAAGSLRVKEVPYEQYIRRLQPVDERRGLTSWKQRPLLRVRFELQRAWDRMTGAVR